MINSNYIPKIIKTQSTGNADSVTQAFSQNRFVKITPQKSSIFTFLNPVYLIEGATYNYYEQNNDATSFNLNNNKQYALNFTANTASLSGITLLNHELYRIRYNDYVNAKIVSMNANTISEATLPFVGTAITLTNSVSEPLITFTDYMTGGTSVPNNLLGNKYTFTFPTVVKPTDSYKIELFEDKAQYFIDSKFIFPKPIDYTLGKIQTISASTIVTIKEYPNEPYEFLESSLGEHVITGNTPFSGLTVRGAFFTYFVPPKKPILNVGGGDSTNPVVGKLPTFSPTYNFNNVDDGDYYRLQATYDITDYSFIHDSLANFEINKQHGDAEFVRTYSTPLTPNKKFLYRIGNTKEIINIFGVKQSLTTWSDTIQAETANDGNYEFSGTCYHGYVSPIVYTADTQGALTIVSGGTVLSGVTLQIIGYYSNSSIDLSVDTKTNSKIFKSVNVSLLGSQNTSSIIATTTSAADGSFSFGRIGGGKYILRITPPPGLADVYAIQNRIISIGADSSLDVILGIIWGNNIIDFTYPTTFL